MGQKYNKRDQAALVAMLRRQGLNDGQIADMLLNPMLEALSRLLPSEPAAQALERAAATVRATPGRAAN